MKTFSNIPTFPFEELLQANIGLSTHKGGALFPDWENEIEVRHCRANRQPVDAMPTEQHCSERWDFSGIWAGPFCGHFGHQISEFSMRLPEALIASPESPVIIGLKYGSLINDVSMFPEYFRSILNWFDIKPGRVRLLKQPTLIAELAVYPQAEMLNGARPTRQHLDRLTERTYRNFRESGGGKGVIYVSRSRFPLGRMAGELYLERHLRSNGVQVFFPELAPLEDQLRQYLTAQHIIFSEGSALHGLQLLGEGLGQVTVLMRRPGAAMFRNFIEPRSSHYSEIDLVSGILYSFNVFGTKMDAQGISVLDEYRVLTWLRTLGLSCEGWSSSGFQAEVEKDVRTWLAEEANRRPLHHLTKGAILNSLNLVGLKSIANEVAKDFPAGCEIPQVAIGAYRKALVEESKGALDSALSAIQDAISADAKVFEFHYKKSVWLDRIGRARDAYLSSSVALSLTAPNDVRVLTHCATVASKAGDVSSGLQLIEQAIEIEPENPGCHGQRSVMLYRLGRTDQALDAAKRSISLRPDNPHALMHCANICAEIGRTEDALVFIGQAIHISSRNPSFHMRKSVLLGRLGQLDGALESARQAVILEPDAALYRFNLSNVLMELGQLESALIEIDRAISIDAQTASFYRQKVQLLERQGRLEEAFLAARDGFLLLPMDASLLAKAAGISSKIGNGDLAISLIDKAIVLAPDNGGFYGLRSVFLDRIGRTAEAKDDALSSIELQPKNPHALVHLSNVLARMKDVRGALEAIEGAIKLAPEVSAFHAHRSALLCNDGNFESALPAALRAVNLAPKDASCRVRLCRVYLGMGELQIALAEIDLALSICGDSEIFKSLRASILRQQG